MKRVMSTLLVAAAMVVTLAGCATREYVVGTTGGRLLLSTTKPELVPGTDLYVYWDHSGNLRTIKQSEIGQVIER
jgi:hypothetical protein